jgi:DNA-binding NtrC family response regulator
METNVLIFVAEDEISIQEVLQDALEDAGFAVSVASSAADAIKKLDAEGADFRALITDVNLGSSKLTGWDVAKHAREINDQIPVVYMTGASAHDWGSRGVPGSILLTKPFANAQVVTAVSQLLNTGSALAE